MARQKPSSPADSFSIGDLGSGTFTAFPGNSLAACRLLSATGSTRKNKNAAAKRTDCLGK
jgi:hypothetical protein